MFSKKRQAGIFGKKKSVKISNADKWFSRYKRLQDVFTVVGDTPYAKCFTCGKIEDVKKMQCGHFIPRNRYNLRFNEKNAHAQCARCNEVEKGNLVVYMKRLDEVYGTGTAQELQDIGSMQGAQKKLGSLYLRELAKEYNKKTRDLEKFLGIYKYFD